MVNDKTCVSNLYQVGRALKKAFVASKAGSFSTKEDNEKGRTSKRHGTSHENQNQD